MEEERYLKDVSIVNGKVSDENYPYDFHIMRDTKNPFYNLFLMLPGIRANTVHLVINDLALLLKVRVQKQYVQLYQAKILIITGSLPVKVKSKVFTIDYDDGILAIHLVEES